MLNRSVSARLRSFAKDGHPVVLYTAGCLAERTFTSTAEAFLRHCPGRVVGVADDKATTDSTTDSLSALEPWAWAGPVPLAKNPLDLLANCPRDTDLVVGISLPGSERLFKKHRDELIDVAEAGHRVINGLNDIIEHPNVINLKAFTPDQRLKATKLEPSAIRIGTVGTQATGPMLSTTIELSQALIQAGWATEWVPTSSSGVLIHGFGRPIDAAPLCCAANLLIELIQTAETVAEVVVVEGQGGLSSPADSALATTIANTTSSRYHVLCHRPAGGKEDLVEVLGRAAERYEALHRGGGSTSTLLGVSLDTSALNEVEARRSVDTARGLGVPAVDWAKNISPLVAALSALTEQERGS